MSTPPLRPGRPADEAALGELQALLSEPSPQLLSTAIAERSNSGPLQTTTLLVTPNSESRPVGYLLAVGSGPTHIVELVVDPDHRREGRGTALLNAVCEAAVQPVTVNVAADNAPARALYERVGFVEASRSAELFDSSEGITLQYTPTTSE